MAQYNALFEELEANRSRKFKEEKLAEYADDMLLRRIFFMGLDPFTNYWIRQIPEWRWSVVDQKRPLEENLDRLTLLANRTYTGGRAREWLLCTLEGCESEDDAKVIEKIIKGDFRCGVQASTVNKIWPNLISEFPVMLATASSEKVNAKMVFPAGVQLKYDGMRFERVLDTIHSRSGKVYDGLEILAKEFPAIPFVIDGELWVDDGTGKPMPRAKGNGIIGKATKGTISEAEAALVRCTVWDMIPYEDWRAGVCNTPYKDRLKALEDWFEKHPSEKIFVVDTKIVDSFDEVNDLFAQSLEAGEEGVMVKDLNRPWTHDRVKHQIKYKAERSADLRCKGWGEGTGKHKGKIGYLELETEDELIECSCGSGLTDADREKDPSEYVGKIIEIVYNERIQSRGDKKESLFLPRFITIRDDKTVANYAADLT